MMSNDSRFDMKAVVDTSDPMMRVPPKHPEYVSEEARLCTFVGHWPPDRSPTAHSIARAGLFYIGSGDGTSCFQCGGGLRNWEAGDDPWIEHAKWFPRCDFVKGSMGQPFILQALQDAQNEQSQEPQSPLQDTVTSGHYRVDPREVQARLDLPAYRSIMDMGYQRTTLEGAVARRLQTTGDDFPNMESLLQALRYEDAITPQIGPEEPLFPMGNFTPQPCSSTRQNVQERPVPLTGIETFVVGAFSLAIMALDNLNYDANMNEEFVVQQIRDAAIGFAPYNVILDNLEGKLQI